MRLHAQGQAEADCPHGRHRRSRDKCDRLAKLEAHEQIRQLAARYALALDSRDVATLVSLFVDDVQTGDGRVGREALAEWFDPILRPYRTTFHIIGNHIIDLVDEDPRHRGRVLPTGARSG